jgi:hypothetical protein
MQRSLLLTAALLAATFAPLQAQQADGDQPPLYRGTYTHVDGVYLTPIAGAPFSATVSIENALPMPDGSVDTQRTINMIGRDSRGRIHNERRRLMTQGFHGAPMLLEVHLFDPQTRLSTFYDPTTRIARQRVLPDAPQRTTPPAPFRANSQVKVEDLGTTMLNGLDAKGTRRTFTVPAKLSGTGKPVEVVDEYWYSEDLHVNLLVRRTDPRTGVQTVAISAIERVEPAPAFFEVPEGYKIVDMTPPPGAPAGTSGFVAGTPTP